ncbi:MAG: tRNA (guanosine(46)-N7)-methyltransferase TrmB [Ferruginibacter sp.]
MAQKKLQRFADIKTFRNVLEYPKDMQGKWNDFFKNDHPVILELACGRGEYTVGLSRMFPEKNFIGVDIKGNRIYIGAKKCLEAGINNAAFLRTQIAMLPDYFAMGEVSEIWITFPDPQLRTSKAKKRLTHPAFLRLYKKILSPGGYIHLKTDSPDLYTFTKKVIELYHLHLVEDCADVYEKSDDPVLKIKTHYEALNIAGSNKIFYLKFKLPAEIAGDDDDLQQLLKETENINIEPHGSTN